MDSPNHKLLHNTYNTSYCCITWGLANKSSNCNLSKHKSTAKIGSTYLKFKVMKQPVFKRNRITENANYFANVK